MKNVTLLLFMIFATVNVQSQNYQITFAGKGASTIVDSVKVENLTQCKDTSLNGSNILHLIGTLEINELNNNANYTLQIYPNPITDNCNIEFEATGTAVAIIELYNITGERIIQEHAMLTKGIHTYQLSGINSGVYFLKITSDKYSYSDKIVSTNTKTGIAQICYKGKTTINENYALKMSSTKKTRQEKAIIEMQYTTGDWLKLTGYSSGIYSTIFMQVPTQTQTDTFRFVACTDADSNHYAVVQMGTQIWMAENLKTTKYNTGVSIGTTIPDTLDISGEATPKYQWAYDGNESNVATYGRLYTWYAVTDSQNITPAGWRIPTDAEWTTLTTYLLGESVAGGKLKENCSTLWNSPNTGATNESGFSALPGGDRYDNGYFDVMGIYGIWWSSTEYDTNYVWNRLVYYGSSDVFRNNNIKANGFSVRCLRDL